MPQFKLDLWARIGLLYKQSFGKFIPLNRSHSKKGLVSQFTNISAYRIVQSITETEGMK